MSTPCSERRGHDRRDGRADRLRASSWIPEDDARAPHADRRGAIMSSPQQRGIRSADSPMEFTPGEFRTGALAAWIIFMLLLVCVLTVLGVLQSGAPWGPPLSGV